MSKNDAVPRFAVSTLAHIYSFDCQKLVQLTARNERAAKQEPNVFVQHQKDRGLDFEQKLTQKLPHVIDCSHVGTGDALATLRRTKAGQTLSQLRFTVPETFYDKFQIQGRYLFRDFIPDFLVFEQATSGSPASSDASLEVFIIDAKSSAHAKVSHYIQVTLYFMLLKETTRDVRNLRIKDVGGILLPGEDEPVTFRFDLWVPRVEHFLSRFIPYVLDKLEPEWVLNAKCKGCAYTDKCRNDVLRTKSAGHGAIPYLKEGDARMLRQKEEIDFWRDVYVRVDDHAERSGSAPPPAEESTADIEDIIAHLHGLDLSPPDKPVTLQPVGYQTFMPSLVSGDRLTQYQLAYESRTPRFVGLASGKYTLGTTHDLIIAILWSPLNDDIFGYGIQLFANVSQQWIFEDYQYISKDPKDSPTANNAHFADSTSLKMRFVEKIHHVLQRCHDEGAKLTVYMYSEQEKSLLLKFLLASSLTLQAEENNLQLVKLFQCVVTLFDCGWTAIANDGRAPILEENGSHVTQEQDLAIQASPCIVVLETLLEENIALGAAGFYQWSDFIEWLVLPYLTITQTTRRVPLDQVSFLNLDVGSLYADYLHDNRGFGYKIEQRIEALHALLQSFRHVLDQQCPEAKTFFPLETTTFRLVPLCQYRKPLLSQLVLFKELEGIGSCKNIRASRFIALQKIISTSRFAKQIGPVEEPDRGLSLIFRRWQKIRDKLVADFQAVGGSETVRKLDALSGNISGQWLLVRDDIEGLASALRFPDHYYRTTTPPKRASLPLFTIHEASIADCCVLIRGYFKPFGAIEEGDRFRMFKRYMDFNTQKVVATIENMEVSSDHDWILDMLRNPNQWSQDQQALTHMEGIARKLQLEFEITANDRRLISAILSRKLQIIWGPPGSGKTRFLSVFVDWYARNIAQAEVQRAEPVIIAVTAYTRSAIHHLLRQIINRQASQVCSDYKVLEMVRETKKAEAGCEDGLSPTAVTCKAIQLQKRVEKLFAKGISVVVIGGTVWDWQKVQKHWLGWKGADVGIIDEGSQLLSADAIVFMAAMSKDARLIVAGDHLQLGPILQYSYLLPSDSRQPLLFGSIQQSLMRTSSGHAVGESNFVLPDTKLRDLGPCTIQMKDNWRMNEEINAFYQQIYGDEYIARYPNLLLDYNEAVPTSKDYIQRALDPGRSIAVVRIHCKQSWSESRSNIDPLTAESNLVAELVEAYLEHRSDVPLHPSAITSRTPPVFVVTPHHFQRWAILAKLPPELSDNVLVDTVEKLQGQECNMVIACFAGVVKEIHAGSIPTSELDFLMDFRRWNVAVSRARSKVIVLTLAGSMGGGDRSEIANDDVGGSWWRKATLEKQSTLEGWGFVGLLEQWALERDAVVDVDTQGL
ncbi:hypothetical protein BZG36_01895 [Bifiguratus adelaidae]|uniref:DNA2/NAM7 helicase-like C-terminal domain-containing protein n=1 Tax=Bifiguratus adelaidae TaxID=1938954 RepID=A0A261Y4F3_9FUNG|nr:hypothetical protein BZG36_01895 [Bifiguratus adelaidae]